MTLTGFEWLGLNMIFSTHFAQRHFEKVTFKCNCWSFSWCVARGDGTFGLPVAPPGQKGGGGHEGAAGAQRVPAAQHPPSPRRPTLPGEGPQ